MLEFLGMVVTVLSEKIGHPGSLQETLMLSEIMKDAEECNYFSLEILTGAMCIGDIRQFPNLPREKALEIIRHDHLKAHFKKTPKSRIEKQIRQVTEIHRSNISRVQKQMKAKIRRTDDSDGIRLDSLSFYSEYEFE